MVMKAAFTITIRRPSVKIKFGLQEIIHSQPKFVNNVLSTTCTFATFFMKADFNTIIPLENDKTVTAEWYTQKCLSHVLKQVEKHRHLNDLTIYDYTKQHNQRNT